MLDNDRLTLSRVRLDNAKVDLQTASENLEAGRYKAANNRAYYAIFHAIRALLALDGVDFTKHSTAIGYFNKNYINTGVIERLFSSIIKGASKSRNNSDYDDFYEASYDEAEKNVIGAGELISAIQNVIDEKIEELNKTTS